VAGVKSAIYKAQNGFTCGAAANDKGQSIYSPLRSPHKMPASFSMLLDLREVQQLTLASWH